MVISEAAVLGLERARHRFEHAVTRAWARTRSLRRDQARMGKTAGVSAGLAHEAPARFKGSFRDGDPGVTDTGEQADLEGTANDRGRLSAAERRARLAAVRGLMLARKRRYAPAQTAFAEAATLDPRLDLTHVPTFWQLQRGGQEAAVRALEEVGRVQEAAALAATLRSTYRPRLLPAVRRAEQEG